MAPSTDFLSLLPDGGSELRRLATPRTFRRGSALFHAGQAGDRVFMITSGEVKLTRVTEGGKEVVLGVRGAGELLGELSAIDGRPRSASAHALTEVETQVVSQRDFRAAVTGNPDAARAVMEILAARLRESDETIFDFVAHDTVGRIARRLVDLAGSHGVQEDAGIRIDLPISQEELAGWVGSSREAVAKALQMLRDLGWVETGRRVMVVRDLEALERRAS
jgi:CRP-like cAMP-binding protein